MSKPCDQCGGHNTILVDAGCLEPRDRVVEYYEDGSADVECDKCS